jgi:hypothetical protein
MEEEKKKERRIKELKIKDINILIRRYEYQITNISPLLPNYFQPARDNYELHSRCYIHSIIKYSL